MRIGLRVLYTFIFLILAGIASCFLFGSAKAYEASDPEIRVLISTDQSAKIDIAVEGTYECFGKQFTDGIITITVREKELRVRHSKLGILGYGETITIHRLDAPVWESYLTFDNTRYGTCKYLGDLTARFVWRKSIHIINTVGMREYLYGVVGGELRDTHPEEALKAQAVVAKCFALTSLNSSRSYDLNDTASDQVYKGYNPAHENVMRAVDEVVDDYLIQNGDIVRSYYCTTNGGYTLTPDMRWTERSSNNSVFDSKYDSYDLEGSDSVVKLKIETGPVSNDSPLYSLLLNATREYGKYKSVDRIYSVASVTDYTGTIDNGLESETTEPVYAKFNLLVTDSKGKQQNISCNILLSDFLDAGIVTAPKANVAFVHEDSPTSWNIIFSRSIGHRVGLSHTGMLKMAELGKSYESILSYYYPGADLIRISEAG